MTGVRTCRRVGAWASCFTVLAGSWQAAGAVSEPTDAEASRPPLLELPVQVLDEDGSPVADARVTPWALRSSQGHGLWSADDQQAEVDPQPVQTDAQGRAIIIYPRFRDLQERTRTLSVSLAIDHPDHAYVAALHIDVPLEMDDSHVTRLEPGYAVEIRPLNDGAPVSPEGVIAIWSDGRSWQPGASASATADGTLQIPAMPAGPNSVLLIQKIDGQPVRFSKIVDFEVRANSDNRFDVPLRSAARIEGRLSENVPRPVRGGRIKARTLAPAGAESQRAQWLTWTPVQPDGSFVIEDWPADEPVQWIALCDGYIAQSGEAPAVVENPRDPATDPFLRPQVFEPPFDRKAYEIEMTPLAQCTVTAVDDGGTPVPGLEVVSWPNVGWWNGGSQIYGTPLVRGERIMELRSYQDAIDDELAPPFRAATNADGVAVLQLPTGNGRVAVHSEVYELPVFLGVRSVRVTMLEGQTTEVVLQLQPRGTERLGEWDKLAGVVFGCSTREGRRICALPGVRAKINQFEQQFREAKNQRDPRLLAAAYAVVAEAFAQVGDTEESLKWLDKASRQRALAEQAE